MTQPMHSLGSVKFCSMCRCKTWHIDNICEWIDGHHMTTPTDAQIGEILRDCASNGLVFNHEEAQTFARIKARESNLARCYLALTAAAEKGFAPERQTQAVCKHTGPAEVGSEVGRMSAWDDRYSGSAKEIEAHTIERCAQVAEDFLQGPLGKQVAAAIRTLKDKA